MLKFYEAEFQSRCYRMSIFQLSIRDRRNATVVIWFKSKSECRPDLNDSIWIDGYQRNYLMDRLEGMVSLKFRVYVDGAAASYTYKQSDELLKSQLWSAAQQRHCTDVELVINGANHVMAAHRAVLSARSPVFQAMFEENRSDKSGKIHVSDVDPAIFEHFLRFIYTGELQTTTNKSLATLAAKYQVETLLKLCENTDNKGVPQVEDVPVLLMSMKPVKPSPTQPGRLTQ